MGLSRVKTAALALLAAGALFLAGYAAFAGDGDEPGGSGDPLVTRSYVDQYVQWKVADLKAGQVLTGRAGSEFIVRRGQAVVVDATGNGVPDVTGGLDLYNGERAPLNHLLVFPREDGRGIRAAGPVVVMYRGGAVTQ
ncbi:MAG: hypothetical protein K6T29_09335 [Peptococcaceae bacterium]|nr:hypothetical protein [Peptococcaceae bacterium]